MNKPNVVLILVDQLRTDRLSSFKIFDDLRSRGTFFSQMVTYAPYTVASLHAIITGMYGNENGVDSYFGSIDFDEDNCFTLAQYLKEHGYRTEADVLSKIVLPYQGFDKVSVHDEYKDDLLAIHKEMIEGSLESDPFFLLLHYSKIHTGTIKNIVERFSDFDDEYYSSYDHNLKKYDELVSEAERYLVEILDHCKRKGLCENTLFIVMSDHGCSLGEKNGEKCYGVFTYDYTVRTFAYLLFPKVFAAGKEIPEQVRTIDIAPTVMEILGIPQNISYKPMQGESLISMMSGDSNENRDAFIETAALSGPYPSPYEPNIHALRTGKWKFIHNRTTGSKELYDIQNDPKESFDVSSENTEIVSLLWDKLKKQGKYGARGYIMPPEDEINDDK